MHDRTVQNKHISQFITTTMDVDSINDSSSSKRRRRAPTAKFEFDGLNNEEQKLIQQAIRNSKKDVKRTKLEIPEAPTFRPTVDQFKDPLGYINKIRPEAEKFGICKIIPPAGWNPPCQIDFSDDRKFASKRQQIHTLQQGVSFDDGRNFTLAEYKAMGDAVYKAWSHSHHNDKEMTMEELAKDYWDMVETSCREAVAEYANDIDTLQYRSGFIRPQSTGSPNIGVEAVDCDDMFSRDYYARTGWNLINLPTAEGSVLKFIDTPINGVNVPWLYLGMLFATFCWHNEDNYMSSINYSHFGAVKQWYGVPGSEAKNFEKISRSYLLESFQESPDLLHYMTTQIPPSVLLAHDVPVCKATQEPRTFIVTFPQAYHGGFSYGFNCGEAVNFAAEDWLVAGGEADERYRGFARPSVFSHQRLLFTLLQHKDELAPSTRLELAREILKVLDSEVIGRDFVLDQGVKDLSVMVTLPPNDFTIIDKKAADYDDLRSCHLCKHICLLSAVACECDQARVSCLRHFHLLCKCSANKKYLLAWAKTDDLRRLQAELIASLRSASSVSGRANSSSDII